MPARCTRRTSQAFLGLLVGPGGVLGTDYSDEILAQSLLVSDGEVRHAPTKALLEGPELMIDAAWLALYIAVLTAFTGYEVISRVPVLLHTPLMSGSNFVHGVVLVGALVALGAATNGTEQVLGFVAVVLAAANVTGGYAVTERILEMFERSKPKPAAEERG